MIPRHPSAWWGCLEKGVGEGRGVWKRGCGGVGWVEYLSQKCTNSPSGSNEPLKARIDSITPTTGPGKHQCHHHHWCHQVPTDTIVVTITNGVWLAWYHYVCCDWLISPCWPIVYLWEEYPPTTSNPLPNCPSPIPNTPNRLREHTVEGSLRPGINWEGRIPKKEYLKKKGFYIFKHFHFN